MENLRINDIHPFVRKVGTAFGLTQSSTMKSYDHRLIFFSDGGKLWLGGKEHTLCAWDVAIVAPGTGYRVVLEKNQKITVVNFDLTTENRLFEDRVLTDIADEFDCEKNIIRNAVAEFMPGCGYLIRRANKTVFKLCEKMAQLYFDAEKELKMLLLSGVLMEIIGELLHEEPQRKEKSRKIYEYICQNFQNDITLDDLSERFNYHKTYINRLLKRDYDLCFKQLVIELRLDHSLILLEESDMSLAEISDCLGFYDSKHFGHSFKKRFGINPSEYRK